MLLAVSIGCAALVVILLGRIIFAKTANFAWIPYSFGVVVLCLLLYLVFRPTSAAKPAIDLSGVEARLNQILNGVESLLNSPPVVSQPINPFENEIKSLQATILKIEKRKAQLERDLALEKKRCNRPQPKFQPVFNAEKYQIDRHYQMREIALREFYRAPWREGEGDRVLCFSTNMEAPECLYRDRQGTIKKMH